MSNSSISTQGYSHARAFVLVLRDSTRSYVIPNLDIYRSANVLVKQHGQDAPIHAAMRADTTTMQAIPSRRRV